jgi:3-oxoacyl-[acyl-carrier protein] reductase
MTLDGKVAIVTGGGRGIGRAIAAALAKAGAKVVVTAARGGAEVAKTASEIGAMAVQADVTKEADCKRVVEEAKKRFGGLHILVNNAGRGYRIVLEANAHLAESERLKFWNTPTEIWRQIVDTNVTGPFLMAKAAVPEMMKQRWGRIINIGVTRNSMTRGNNAPYGVSKTTIEPATLIWSQDLAGTGVTVNTLLPGGATATAMATALSATGGKALLDPAIMGPPAVWLASEEAADVTGARVNAKAWDMSLQGRRAFDGAWVPQVFVDSPV